MKKALIFFLITILLAGCAGVTASPATTDKGGAGNQATPTVQNTPVPTSDQMVPAIVIVRTGGIAGIHNKWTIYADGQVFSESQLIHRLSAEQVKSALATIQKLGFFDLQADYSKDSTCMDCFLVTVTVNSGGTSKTVKAVEGDTRTPSAFLQVTGVINGLVTAQQP